MTDHLKEMSDDQLLQAVAQGQLKALLHLHHRYAPQLTALAQRLKVPHRDQAVEDVFVAIWRSATSAEHSPLSAQQWLVLLAYRQFMGAARSPDCFFQSDSR